MADHAELELSLAEMFSDPLVKTLTMLILRAGAVAPEWHTTMATLFTLDPKQLETFLTLPLVSGPQRVQ